MSSQIMPVRQQSGRLSPFKTKNKSTQRQKHTQTINCFASQLMESSLNEIRAILHKEIDCMLSGAYLKSCNFETGFSELPMWSREKRSKTKSRRTASNMVRITTNRKTIFCFYYILSFSTIWFIAYNKIITINILYILELSFISWLPEAILKSKIA